MSTTIPILSRVKHAVRRQNDDRWEGVVLERQTTESAGGQSRTTYKVRWIKPDGDPSDTAVIYEADELVVIDPPWMPRP